MGIALSGGGLRAALFSMGVLQELQEQRGLLFGPRAARVLSAVSGGSYIASAYVSNGAALVAEGRNPESVAPPFAKGTPEEGFVLSRGRYLLDPLLPRVAQLGAGVLAGPIALLALLLWAGFILADIAVVIIWVSVGAGVPMWFVGWPWWTAVPIAAIAAIMLARELFQARSVRQTVTSVVALALLIVALPPAVASLDALGEPARLSGWTWPILIAFTAVALAAGAALAASRVGIDSPVFGAVERGAVAVLMLVVIGAAMMFMVPFVVEILFTPEGRLPSPAAVWWMIGGLLAPFPVAWLLRRLSLHQFYREALRSTFGVMRRGDDATVPPESRRLSDLDVGSAVPRLLISATANGHGGTHRYENFVFSHDRCGVPGTRMWHETQKLELALTDGHLASGPESVLTLPTGVAATGAALSASMGRYTRPSARLLLALFNVRLGRTIPSVGREDRRRVVAQLQSPGRLRTRTAFLPGLDDLVAEMLGVAGPNMYVSDGGHYDNLGVIPLLHARCRTIVCVDASPRPQGDCPDLARAIELARVRGIQVDIDARAFAATSPSVFPVTHVTGTVRYDDGEVADLHVIKLGLHQSNLAEFEPYRRSDPKFPHHSTLNQLYPTVRMERYRDLGRDNASRLLSDVADFSS